MLLSEPLVSFISRLERVS